MTRFGLSMAGLLLVSSIVGIIDQPLWAFQDDPFAPADVAPVTPATTRPASRLRQPEKPADANEKKIDPESLAGLKTRFHEVQTELAKRKKLPAPMPPDDNRLIVVLENPHLSQGRHHSNNQYNRSFVIRVLIGNPTTQAVQLKRSNVKLLSDQKTYPVLTNNGRYYDSYSIGQNHYSLSSLKMDETVDIPPGKTASTWVVFGDLPMSPAVPDLKLTLELGQDKREIDVNEYCSALLQTNVKRLGPKDCLALVTIAGKLDPVNVKDLVDLLDELSINQKLARVVIRWESDAEPVESNLMDWLQRSVNEAGQIRPNNQNPSNTYPIVPMSIREFHLAEIPKNNGRSVSSNRQARIHKTSQEAIIAGLRTAYQALSANEIVDDLRDKDLTIRSAALMGGGGRLPPDKLPVLLEFVNSEDRNLQRAAIFAMRNFGEDRAIQTLIELVKKNDKPRCTEAAESLATSRFASASMALIELLKSAESDVKTNIVEVLAKYPKPVWADTMAEYARHPETSIGIASLRALNGIGHPNLLGLLREALQHNESSVQMEAFNLLAARKDAESEALALEFTLKHLRTQQMVGQMSSLITRTKEPRAIPLLLRQFQSQKNNRSALINTLAQIGDQSVVELFVAEFPKCDQNEKRYILQALQQLHSPEFVRLASLALLENNSSLINFAADGLYKDGSPEAEQALIEALSKDAKHNYWSYLCNALTNFATPEAREALREARNSANDSKKNAAINALRSLQQRSPGNQYMYQAREFAKQKQWDNAIKYYNLSIEADSEYADAYSGRGTANLNLKKNKEAKADFERAIKADPESTQGHTGLAICMIIEGKIEEGVKYAEDNRNKLEAFESNKGLLRYNTACVYGRAVEKLNDQPMSEARSKQLDDYRKKAIDELKEAIKNRFTDFDLMKSDPDLQSLAKLPDFQNLLPKPPKDERKRPNLNVEDAVDKAAF